MAQTIEELEAELTATIFRLQEKLAVNAECIRIGEGLARANGYARGYAAGRALGRRKSARRARSSQPGAKPFPILVRSGGRSYEVNDELELDHCVTLLVKGYLQKANQYRVADTKYSRWKKATT